MASQESMGKDKRSGSSSFEVRHGEMFFVDSFPKDRVTSVNEKVTEFLGSKPVPAPIQAAESSDSDTLFSWRPSNLEPAFTAVLRTSSTPTPDWGGSIDLFHKFISSISAEGLVSSDLPFYLLVLRVELNSSALAGSPNLKDELLRIRNPMRVFLESLDGFNRKGASWSPVVPVFVLLGIQTDQRSLSMLQKEARNLGAHGSMSALPPTNLIEHRKLLPFALSWDGEPDIWSHFILASNVSIILGHVDQFALLGTRTPYVLFLAPEPSLIDFDRLPVALTVRASRFIGIWTIPNIFALPLAVLTWTSAVFLEVQDLERSIGRVSSGLLSTPGNQVDKTSLDELTKLGLRISTLDVQIGLVESQIGETIDRWSKNNIPDQTERRLPSLSRWPSPHTGEDFEYGYLSFFADEIRMDLDKIIGRLRGLERKMELLSIQANDAVLRDSGKKMEMATNASLRAQRAVVNMTYVLVMLTLLLVALALWQNGTYSYAVIVAAMTLVVVARFLASDNPRLYWLVGIALVDFFVLKYWPSNISWLIPLTPIVIASIPVAWWALAPYAHTGKVRNEQA